MDDDVGRAAARSWLPGRLAIIALVVVAALVVALLVRQPQRLVLMSYRGVPAGAQVDLSDPEPGWMLGEDGRLAVYAAGSSSCPWKPTDVTAAEDGGRDVVTVRMEQDAGPGGGGPCTADLGFTTSVVALPAGVDPARLEVEIVQDSPEG